MNILRHALTAVAAIVSLVQCTGFKPNHLSQSSTILSAVDGVALYSAKCASCHGQLAVSTKLNRTAAQITAAFGSVPAMAGLAGLSAAQVNAIATALSGAASAPQAYQCTNTLARGLSENRMRRLIKSELVNTFSDLLGANIIADTAVQTQLGLLSADTILGGVGDLSETPSTSQVEALLEISNRAADLAFLNAANRDAIFGTCAGLATIADSCAQTFISTFTPKAFRRPITAAESTALMAQYKTVSGVEGLKRTLIHILLSPAMAFHLEFGTTVSGNRVRLTDYEIASRLSYRLTGTLPDATLLAAASRGELQTLVNVKTQATRLINSNPHAKETLASFFRFYLQTDEAGDPFAPAAALDAIPTAGLKAEMTTELEEFVNNVVWIKKGKFRDLLTSRDVFPRSARMAKILETTMVTGGTPVLTSEAHAGVMLRPLMFASSSPRTKAYHRSNVIRRRILCQEFGAPDPVLVANREAELGDLSGVSNRERLTRLTNVPACLTCHTSLNPTGFVLEGYDQLGMRRSTEPVFNAAGQMTASFPIDTRVSPTLIENAAGTVASMDSALDLVAAVASGKAARACFAKTVFEFQRWRAGLVDDNCALSDAEKAAMDTGSVLDVFISGVANEDIFWKAQGK